MVFENGTSTYLEYVSTFSISLAYDWLLGPVVLLHFLELLDLQGDLTTIVQSSWSSSRGPDNDCPVLFDL